jgi:SAM-dependent methyltransferase
VGWRAPLDLFANRKDVQGVFTTIYDRAVWGRGSGGGSNPKNAQPYLRFLRKFLRKNRIRSVVDLGCGDWRLSQNIDWSGMTYLGIDVVESVVEANTAKFASATVTFRAVNVFATPEQVPAADLLIVKDVLQHLSNSNVLKILDFARKFKFAIITNDHTDQNEECENGDTRPIDISKPPFAATDAIPALKYDGKVAFVLRGPCAS